MTLSLFFIFITLTLFLPSCKTDAGGGKLTVGREGTITCIEIPAAPGQVEKFAAEELRDYLDKMTGVRLPVIESDNSGDKDKSIRLRDDSAAAGLNWDGFSISAGNSGIVLTAKEPRGLLYGVYQLLEEAGCSFVYLGKREEVVPQKETVTFIAGERVFNPVIELRGLTPYGLQASSVELGRDFIDWMAKNKMNFILISEDRPSDCPGSAHSSIWKEVSNELLPELQKRGFVIEMGEHCTHVFFPRSLHKDHPDWFALAGGERRTPVPPYAGQICYSNKDAVEYYAAAVADYAVKHPEFHIIGTWPLDGGQWCECDGCQGDPIVLFRAIERVAEKVKEVSPATAVEYMIYPKPKGFQPPPDKIPDNMSFLWFPDNGKLDSLARLWADKSRQEAQGTYQFEYLMGDNYRSRANVWLHPRLAVNNAIHARDIGFRGVTSLFLPLENWWRACFNNWFFAKACWNNKLDVDACLHDHCMKYYGKSASETEKIFKSLFSELQADDSFMIYTGDVDYKDKFEIVKPAADKIIAQLDLLISGSDEPMVVERLSRIKAYVGFFRLFYEALSTREEGSMTRLTDYSINHPAEDMVIMAPEYIAWRNSGLFNGK